MVYGIVSAKDNQTSLAYFKSKKVSQGNLVTADKLQQLANVLSAGDVIYVVSVDRFPSVNAFVTFASIVLKTGASMKILEQSYLDVGNGKHYKASIEEHLKVLAGLESVNISRLIGALKLTDAGKEYVIRCVTDISIGILDKTYASDGILHLCPYGCTRWLTFAFTPFGANYFHCGIQRQNRANYGSTGFE